jgi:methanol:N,N-dimethyl-4-nitrosoaniline oxidoreductase
MKEMQKYRRITIPQIAVNTTAGTGAEVSGGAAITNTKARAKHGIDLMGEAPNMAITDPLLVRCMPQTIAAWTGWDAFAHAFESYVSCIQVPCTRAVQTGTIRIVAENLREFSFNRMNHEACERMCYAETMAGLGMMFGGGVGIVHGFGNGLGGLTDGHHGRLCAVLTLQGEKFNEPACPELFAGMAAAMGIDTRGMTTIQAADKWFDAVERLLADLNIQSGHLTEQFGFQQSDMESVVSEYLRGRMGEANPRGSSPEECTKLLKTMM